jgi:hypothetical protein
LELVLSFFLRADAKTQFLTGLVVAMLGFMASMVDLSKHWSWMIVGLAALATGLLLAALWLLYQASYPNLEGGEQSLIYFHEIAKLREATFIERITTAAEGELANDLAAQTWRNSQILDKKFSALKMAHRLVLASVIPWLLTSAISMAIRQNPKLLVP